MAGAAELEAVAPPATVQPAEAGGAEQVDRRVLADRHAATTFYHATWSLRSVPPLLLDPAGGMVGTTGPVSAVAPEYAPPDATQVATLMLGSPDDAAAAERLVRARLDRLYGTTEWDHLRTYSVARALPAMPAPASWPWAQQVVTALTRLTALPGPASLV